MRSMSDKEKITSQSSHLPITQKGKQDSTLHLSKFSHDIATLSQILDVKKLKFKEFKQFV